MAPSAHPQGNAYAGTDINMLQDFNISSSGFFTSLTFTSDNDNTTAMSQQLQALQCKRSAWLLENLKIVGIPMAIGALLVVWLLVFLIRRLVHPAFRKPRQQSPQEDHELVPRVNRRIERRDPPPEYHQYIESDVPGHIRIDDYLPYEAPPAYDTEELVDVGIALPLPVAAPTGRLRVLRIQGIRPLFPHLRQALVPRNRHVRRHLRNSETPWHTLFIATVLLLFIIASLVLAVFGINAAAFCSDVGDRLKVVIAIAWTFFGLSCIGFTCALSYWLILLKETAWPRKQITWPLRLTGLFVLKWLTLLALAPFLAMLGLLFGACFVVTICGEFLVICTFGEDEDGYVNEDRFNPEFMVIH